MEVQGSGKRHRKKTWFELGKKGKRGGVNGKGSRKTRDQKRVEDRTKRTDRGGSTKKENIAAKSQTEGEKRTRKKKKWRVRGMGDGKVSTEKRVGGQREGGKSCRKNRKNGDEEKTQKVQAGA